MHSDRVGQLDLGFLAYVARSVLPRGGGKEGRKEGGAPLVELVAGTARGLRLRWWPSAADGALPPRGGPRDRPTRGERREPARNCGGPLLDLICCCCPLGHVRSLWAE
jgi:hypothetical protein